MNPFLSRLPHAPEGDPSHSGRHLHPPGRAAGEPRSELREFLLKPVVGTKKQTFGSAAVYLAGAGDPADPHIASRIMVDNWLLFGFDEVAGSRAIFVTCSRQTLLSGVLSLLPPSAIFEIPESLKPDEEVLSACRALKSAGYRFALDDFDSLANMEAFLDLADFIKVDWRHSRRRNRACLLRQLRLTRATLVAAEIESEGDFNQAVEDGFELFQGPWVGEHITCRKKSSPLNAVNCTCILGVLEEPVLRIDELAERVNLESGIECRLLRRANWASSPNLVINSTRDALEVVGKTGLQQIVTLAITTASKEDLEFPSVSQHRSPVADTAAGALLPLPEEINSTTPWCNEIGCGGIL